MSELLGSAFDAERYDEGKRRLRAAVVEDGGLWGLFILFRIPEVDVQSIEKYRRLIREATSPEETNRSNAELAASGVTVEERVDQEFMAIAASLPELDPDDIPAMMVAIGLCQCAGIPLDWAPTD